MQQNSDEEGEINLLNSSYSTNRFAFSYSWWSAYGYKNHCRSDLEVAEAMKLTNQADVYQGCGAKVMADLMDGNAVVLFAYGLSGSGKTFTVFGPDAPDAPEAWFKHAKPHDMWGLFPRLAYDLFKQKTDGWKITMKYFQNVVDVVRDLMSPTAAEQSCVRVCFSFCSAPRSQALSHLRTGTRRACARIPTGSWTSSGARRRCCTRGTT